MLWVLVPVLRDGSLAAMTQHMPPRLLFHSKLHSHIMSMVVSALAFTDTNLSCAVI